MALDDVRQLRRARQRRMSVVAMGVCVAVAHNSTPPIVHFSETLLLLLLLLLFLLLRMQPDPTAFHTALCFPAACSRVESSTVQYSSH